MSVITISREFGSVGDDVGQKIAEILGYHYVDKEFVGALLRQYGIVEFDREYEAQPGFLEGFYALRDKRRDVIVDMLNQVVRGVARHGHVVIQGRSGFAVLKGFADVLNVRLQAPLSFRIERTKMEQGMTVEQAAAVVKERDRVRRAFVESFYGVPWDAVEAFDLVINTGKIPAGAVATLVVDAAEASALTRPVGEPTTSLIEVDSVLASAIAKALACTAEHG